MEWTDIVHIVVGAILGILLGLGSTLYTTNLVFNKAFGSICITISIVGVAIYLFYQGIEKEPILAKFKDIFVTFMFTYLLGCAITFYALNLLIILKVLLYS